MNQSKAAARARQAQSPSAAGAADQAVPNPPRTMLIAVRLMYAGAVVTAVGVVLSVITVATGTAAIRAAYKHATIAQVHQTQSALITGAVFQGLITIGAWVLMARMNRGGVRWARIAGTVLFGLNTVILIRYLVGGSTAAILAYAVLMWLIGAATVFFLWQRDSSAYLG